MPKFDPRDRFFYPTLILLKDSYKNVRMSEFLSAAPQIMKLTIQNLIVSNWLEESINQEREAGKYTLLKIFKGTMRVLPLITIQMHPESDSKQELD